jgi:hypothetical protein
MLHIDEYNASDDTAEDLSDFQVSFSELKSNISAVLTIHALHKYALTTLAYAWALWLMLASVRQVIGIASDLGWLTLPY